MKTPHILIVLLTLLVCPMRAQHKEMKSRDKMEIPKTNGKERIITHTGYTLSFNSDTNCPDWVAWELTSEEVNANNVSRSNDFQSDPAAPRSHQVEPYDYRQSGYDRGHMCPAADMRWSTEAMSECFYMTNICPQTQALNQKWWEHLERACRRWATQEGKVYICCGPIYYNKKKAKSIGKDTKVLVPDAFFKVVLSMKEGKEKAIGFIYSNSNERQTMEDAAVTVDEVENITNLDFFSSLPNNIEKELESKAELKKWR